MAVGSPASLARSWPRLRLQHPHHVELRAGLAHRGDGGRDLPAVVRAMVEHMAQRDCEGQRLRDALRADVLERPTPAAGIQRLDEGLPAQRALDQALTQARAIGPDLV